MSQILDGYGQQKKAEGLKYEVRKARPLTEKENIYACSLRIHALCMLVCLCAESTRVLGAGGGVPSLPRSSCGIGVSYLFQRGVSVSRSVEESGVGH